MVGGRQLSGRTSCSLLLDNGGLSMDCRPTQAELDAATQYVTRMRMETAAPDMHVVICELLEAYAPDRHKHKRTSLHSSVRKAMDILDKIDGKDPR